MSENKLQITFPNKKDAGILADDSQYVFTAANINEIKEVVNNISEKLTTMDLFSDVFKYIELVVPKFIEDSEVAYDLIMELSSDKSFSQSESTITITTENASDREKICLFENGIWKSLAEIGKNNFSKNDRNKIIKINVHDAIEESTKRTYFGRYKWSTTSSGSLEFNTEWKGFVIRSKWLLY